MAMMGIGEILIMLLMGTFAPADLDPLPPDQILSGMPADCEVVGFADLRGGFGEINAIVSDLSTRPWVVGNRELSEGLAEVNSMLTRAPAEATTMFGFDPFTEMTSISICGRLSTGPGGEPLPSLLIVARGNFDATLASLLAAQVDLPPIALSNGAAAFGEMENGTIYGMASPTPGVLYVGSDDLLAPRAAGAPVVGWEGAAPESLVSRFAALAPGGPRAFMGFQPSAGTRFLISGELPVSMAQLLAGLDRGIWMSTISSSQIETRATTPAAMQNFELILGGVASYAQGAPYALRAFAQIALGVLSPDDPELEPGLRALVANRDDFLSFLDEQGFFQEAEIMYASDPTSMTTSLSVTNTGGMEATAILFGMGMGMAVMVGGRSDVYYEEPYLGEEYAPYPASAPTSTP